MDCEESSCSKSGLTKSHIGGSVMMWKGLKEADSTIGILHSTHRVSRRGFLRIDPKERDIEVNEVSQTS